MAKRLRIGVLGSTNGTDLQAVIDAIEKKQLEVVIVVVVSNKADAFILQRAKIHGIKSIFLNPKKFSSREKYDVALAEMLVKEKVDLVLLIGYMRVLSPLFCKKFENKIMNIHPSLLPLFAGKMNLDVHSQVKKMGLKETGCTLHFVTSEVDGGPVILQEKVPVFENDSVEDIKNRVQRAEQEIILKALKLFAEHKIVVKGKKVVLLE
ncbi:MAG: phosphoribosylglycinamide formyltransferase [Candidatus Diapherotrites archaeon]|nr:phosphoribosylglycinamide formyltransferase [Candidatus Diapherotrites archaeon]